MGSSTSGASAAAIPYTKPGAATNVTATKTVNNGELTVTWTNPASNNGSAINKIEIINTRNSNKVRKTLSPTENATDFKAAGGASCSSVVSGLTGGQLYGIAVRVYNAAGYTDSASVDATPAGPPLAPTGVSAAGTGEDKVILVQWTVPNNNGQPITSVDIINQNNASLASFSSTSDRNGWINGKYDQEGQKVQYYITVPENGKDYNIRVRCNSSAGTGTASSAVNAYAYTNPQAPVITAVEGGVKTLTVKWNAPEDTGGTPILGYRVYQVVNGNRLPTAVAEVTGTQAVITKQATSSELEHDREYSYQVIAYNKAGDSLSPSNTMTGKTYWALKNAPQNVKADSIEGSGNTAKLTWTAPAAEDGNGAPTKYVIHWTPAGSTPNSGEIAKAGSETVNVSSLTKDENGVYTYIIKDLAIGGTYNFTIGGDNGAGEGKNSDPVQAILYDVPAVREVKTASGQSQITVEWRVDNESEERIESYTVYAYTQEQSGDYRPITSATRTIQVASAGEPHALEGSTGLWRSCVITGLTNGNTYAFRVTATNDIGTSKYGNYIPGMPTSAPGEPSVVVSTAEVTSTGTLDVVWGKAPDNGKAVTEYQLQVRNFTGSENSVLATFENLKLAPTQGTQATLKEGSSLGDAKLTYYLDQENDKYKGTITGLVPGDRYVIAVMAKNPDGWGHPGLSAVTPTLRTPPGATVQVSATGDPGTVAVNWTDNGDGGREITKYRLVIYAEDVLPEGEVMTTEKVEALKEECKGLHYAEEVSEGNVFWGNATADHGATIRIREITPDALKTINESETDYLHWMVENLDTGDHVFSVQVQAMSLPETKDGDWGWGELSFVQSAAAYGAPKSARALKGEIQDGADKIKFTWQDPANTPTASGGQILGNGGRDVVSYAVQIFKKTEAADESGQPVWENVSATVGIQEHAQTDDELISAIITSSHDGDKFDAAATVAAIKEALGDAKFIVRTGVRTDVDALQTMTLTGVKTGETYQVVVYPINLAGASLQKAETKEITLWDLPGAVQQLAADPNKISGQLDVTWYAPAEEDLGNLGNNEAHNITGIEKYQLFYKLHTDADYTGPITIPANNEEALQRYVLGEKEDEVLEDGKEYDVYVLAVNRKGVSQTTPAPVQGTPVSPAGPATISGVASGNSSAVLKNIARPQKDGGSEIVQYEIYAAQVPVDNEGNVLVQPTDDDYILKRTVTYVKTADNIMQDITVPDLVNGYTYLLRVRAINGPGYKGEPSNTVKVLVGLPEMPRDLQVEPGENYSVVASVKPGNHNGNPILYYYAYVNGSEEPYSVDGEPVRFTNPSDIRVPWTKGGAEVSIAVTAWNRVGQSEKTPMQSIRTGAPTSPKVLDLVAGDTEATISWTGSKDNGLLMQHYTVSLRAWDPEKASSNGETGDWGDWIEIGQVDARNDDNTPEEKQSYSLTMPKNKEGQSSAGYKDLLWDVYPGLKAGTVYQMKVNGRNAVAQSPDSEFKDFTFGVPDAPTITAVEAGDQQLTVSFTAPKGTGLNEDGTDKGTLTGFNVYANGVLKAAVTAEMLQTAAGAPEKVFLNAAETLWYEGGTYYAKITGLANGAGYTMRVRATNINGESPSSEPVSGTPRTMPHAPRNVVAIPDVATVSRSKVPQVNLSWKAPLYNGGVDIDTYHVSVLDDKGNPITDTGIQIAPIDMQTMTTTVTGLAAGTTYGFSITAENAAGEGAASQAVYVTTLDKPSEPQNVSTSAVKDISTGKYNLTIYWEEPENTGGTPITGYRVWNGASLKSGTSMLPPDNKDASGRNSFTLTGLDPKTYTIRIEAFNKACQDSTTRYGNGTCVTITPLVGRIAAPANLKVDDTKVDPDSQEQLLTLTWDPVADTFPSYWVYDLGIIMEQKNCTLQEAISDLDTNGGTLGRIADTTDTSYVMEMEEVDWSTHYYVVCARTNTGDLGYLSQEQEYTRNSAEPLEITEVKGGLNSMTITFEPADPGPNESYSLLGYQLLLGGVPFTGEVYLAGEEIKLNFHEGQQAYTGTELTTATKPITLRLQGLTGNRSYTLTARAITVLEDGAGTSYLPGKYEMPTQSELVWDRPTAPEWVGDVSGDGMFTVNFKPTVNSGGLPLAGYAVYCGETPDNLELKAQKTVRDVTVNADGTLSIPVEGIENNTDCFYYVAAYTEQETEQEPVRYYSEHTETDIKTVRTGVPTAPKILSVVTGDRTIMLTYSEPQMEGDMKVTSYRIRYTAGDVEKEQMVNNPVNTWTLDEERNGIVNGREYKIEIQAINQYGGGAWSDAVTVTPGVPEAPVILDYAVDNSSITVRWDSVLGATSYRVYYTDEDGSRYVKNVDVNENSLTLSELTNGVEYEIEVKAVNQSGESRQAQILKLTPGTKPQPPQNVAAEPLDGTRVKLSWMAPADDGGLAVDRYQVSYSGEETAVPLEIDLELDNEFLTTEETDDGLVYSYTVAGLISGSSYDFTVKSHNKRDYSEAASIKAETYEVPGAPQWRGISSVNFSFTAKWNAPEVKEGDSEITGYTIYVDDVPVTMEPIPVSELTSDGNVYSYTVDKLSGEALKLGQTYQITLAAWNVVGEGAKSSAMEITIQGQAAESVPGRPGTPEVSEGNGQLEVTWAKPLIEGVVQGVTGYTVYCRALPEDGEPGAAIEAEITGRDNCTHTFTGLENGTSYEIWVVAHNRIGDSDRSSVVTATPKEIAKPKAPTNIRYQNNATMNAMTISWDEVPESEYGGKVSYLVYVNDTATSLKDEFGEDVTVTRYTETVEQEDGTTTPVTRYKVSMAVESNTRYKIWVVAKDLGGTSGLDPQEPDAIAYNWLNVETTGAVNAKPDLNLDRDCDGELDPDQLDRAPTAPGNLSVTVDSNNQVTLSWEVPYKENTDEPFTNIEYYKIYMNGTVYINASVDPVENPDPNKENQHLTVEDDVIYTWKSNTRLENRKIYSFQVSAVNEQGEGVSTAPVQIYVQSGNNSAPTGLVASRGDRDGENLYTKVSLSWTEPVGGQPANYVVQVNGVDQKDKMIPGGQTSTEWDVRPDSNYVFRVYAIDEQGVDSKTTNAENISTTLATPSAPTGLEGTVRDREDGRKTVHLTWAEPDETWAGYYLYVDGKQEGTLITDTQTDYITDEGKELTFTVVAVNQITATIAGEGEKTFERQSAQSEAVLISTSELDENAPGTPTGLSILGSELQENDAMHIQLTWRPVNVDVNNEPLGAGTVSYEIMVGRDDEPFQAVAFSEEEAPALDEATGMIVFTYKDPAHGSGHSYVFRVRAIFTPEGGEPIRGALSASEQTNTKQVVKLPAAPEGLKASVNEDKTEITLSWSPVEDASITGYAVYVDAELAATLSIAEGKVDRTSPSYTYKVPAETARALKQAFYFQVAAVNDSKETNSLGKAGYSELSQGLNVSLDPEITDLPAPAKAPTIVRSIHQQVEGKPNVIRIYWTAPTEDTNGDPLEAAQISGYQINIAKINSDGTTETAKMLAERYEPQLDSEGLIYYEIPVDGEYPIELGEQYGVTITAWRNHLSSSGVSAQVPGASQTPWIIRQNLNVDTKGDGKADQHPDENGDGIEDVTAGTLVTITANVTADGSSAAPEIQLIDESGTVLEPEGKAKYNADTGLLEVEYRLMSATGTYTVKACKPGCTWFALEKVPLGPSLTGVHLNDYNSDNEIKLYAGDANGDGSVDIFDLSILKGSYGDSGTVEDGNFNGDSSVDIFDLSILKGNYGSGSDTIQWK